MKRSTKAFIVLASAGFVALAALAARDDRQTAEQFLASIEKRHASGKLRLDQYLRELALAQTQAQHDGQPELATRVQLQRGRVLLDLGSYAEARRVLASMAAEAGALRDLALLRIELERRAGDPVAGLELAREWLRTHPDDARALQLSGQLQRMQAEAARDEALLDCEKELASADAQRAQTCVRGLSQRPPTDLRRVALARDLRTLFGTRLEPSAERLLVLCDNAAAKAAGAREALGRSLELSFDVEALTQLAELFEQAGQAEEALDLFTAASKLPAVLENEHAMTFLVHELVVRRRWRHATLVASAWLEKHKGSPEFMLDACRACYEGLGSPGAYERLYNWSLALFAVLTQEMGATPYYYLGEAFFSQRNRPSLEAAYKPLSVYALREGPEPVPRARAIAFRHLAECGRVLELGEEREMLEAAVGFDARNGEAWLRLAELQLATPRGGFREPDLRWARGMALLPARQAELMPRWLEIGAGELRALGLDTQSIEKSLQSGLAVRPSNGAAPFELYTLAAAYSRVERPYDAQALLQDLDKLVPDFLPAIDLRIDMARAHGRTRELVEAFLERLELAGYDERTRELRVALPEGALSSADLRRIVRADPETSGRLALARSLAARGEPRSALGFLLEIPGDRLRPAEQALTARMELESGAADAAFARASALDADLGRTPGALETWVEAGLRTGHTDTLAAELPKLIAPLELDSPRFLTLSDRLLASGEARLARTILRQIDQARKRPRGGDVLWRLSACALALPSEASGDFERELERASAFDTRGEVELLTLLALPPETAPDSLQAAVHAVRKAGWNPSPLADAALTLLAGDPAGMRSALDAAREQDEHDPLPALLAQFSGTPSAKNPADAGFLAAVGPRGLAQLVLELERPALGACALARLDALGAAASPTWTGWFRARLHRNAGERESEERVLRALLERDPHFVAAWDRLIELRGSATDAEELDLRLARAAALGESALSQAEREWNRSRQLEREGAFASAMEAARAAAAAAGENGPILLHLGRLALRTGDVHVALDAFRRALPLLPAPSAARARAEYVELLARAREQDPPLLDAEAQRAELEGLAAGAADDPLVLLAQARNDLETSATDPAFGAQRAYERLDHFRERLAKRSFEDLAAGSTERWTRFLLELDPARARAFVESELDRDPGVLQAWALLPRCSAALGRDEQALTELTFVEQLAPRADVLSEYMRVRARSDWTPEGVAEISERLRNLAPAAGSAPAALALELRAYLSLGPRGVPKLLELSAQLTPELLDSQPTALRAEVYWMQCVALLARDEGDDRAQARMRAAALDTLVRDPARRPLVAALRGLAQSEVPATAELHDR